MNHLGDTLPGFQSLPGVTQGWHSFQPLASENQEGLCSLTRGLRKNDTLE